MQKFIYEFKHSINKVYAFYMTFIITFIKGENENLFENIELFSNLQ